MERHLVTCHVRYVLDPDKLDSFREYGRLWVSLITKLGGHVRGAFSQHRF